VFEYRRINCTAGGRERRKEHVKKLVLGKAAQKRPIEKCPSRSLPTIPGSFAVIIKIPSPPKDCIVMLFSVLENNEILLATPHEGDFPQLSP